MLHHRVDWWVLLEAALQFQQPYSSALVPIAAELYIFSLSRSEDEWRERCKTSCHGGTETEWRQEKDGLTFSPERAARKGDRPS